MKRIACGIAALTIAVSINMPVFAATMTLEASVASAQKSLESKKYKTAETTLRKTIDQAATSGAQDVNLARANVLLATVLRSAGKHSQAADALKAAYGTYKTLGFVEPTYVDEAKNLAASYQLVDNTQLGAGSSALNRNSAVISLSKTEGLPHSGHVEIRMPNPLENSLNSTKIDGLQMEAVVSFDIEVPQPGTIHASNIKGFKIHSVEKNMWVNLMEVTTGSADAEGKIDATIVAGKAGISKTVPAKLPAKAYEPISVFGGLLDKFGTAVAIDLPVQTAKPAEQTATTATPVSAPAAASEVQTTQSVQTTQTVQTTEVVPSQPVSTTTTVITPVSQTEVVQPAVEAPKPAAIVPPPPAAEPTEKAKAEDKEEPTPQANHESRVETAAKEDSHDNKRHHENKRDRDDDGDNDKDDDDDDDKKNERD
jgi:hypothetical protein